MENQEFIRAGHLKYTTLGGYKAKIIVEQYTDCCIIIKRVLIPKKQSLKDHIIIRKSKTYKYVQESLTIQSDLISSIFQFLNKPL